MGGPSREGVILVEEGEGGGAGEWGWGGVAAVGWWSKSGPWSLWLAVGFLGAWVELSTIVEL